MNNIAKGILLCTVSGIAFGGQWPVAGNALKIIDPFYFTFVRYLLVSVCLLIMLVVIEGKSALNFEGKICSLWFFGTVAFSIYNFLAFTGQKLLGDEGAIIGSVLMALIPTVALIISWLFTDNKPTYIAVFNVVLAFLGVFLVITKGNFSTVMLKSEQTWPIVLMLFSVLSWVIYTVGGSKFKGWSSLRYTALSCILGNISSLIIILFLTKISFIQIPDIHLLLKLKWEFIYMSFIAGVVGVYTWNFGNLLLKPINGSLFINLVPIVTFIISIFNGYVFSSIELIGTFMVILSLFINNVYQRFLLLQNRKRKDIVVSKEGKMA